MAAGAAPGRIYLIGRTDLYQSDDGGASWRRVEHGLPDRPTFSALAVAPGPSETLYAVIDGAVMTSGDAGRTWRPRGAGLPQAPAEALSLDPMGARLWVASADRIYDLYRHMNVLQGFGRSDDWVEAWFTPRETPAGSLPMMDYYRTRALTKDDVNHLLDDYYAARGWDVTSGNPPLADMAARAQSAA
jgi:hypothetical protein